MPPLGHRVWWQSSGTATKLLSGEWQNLAGHEKKAHGTFSRTRTRTEDEDEPQQTQAAHLSLDPIGLIVYASPVTQAAVWKGDFMSIGNIVSRNAMRFPDREALVYEDIRYTWTQLNERVNRLADAFLSMGLQKGDKVAMISENVPAMVEANYALAKIGVVFFPVKTRLFPEDVRHLIDLSDARVLLFHEEFIPMVDQIMADLTKIRTFIQVGGETQGYAVDYEAFLSQGRAREPEVDVSSDDPYIFLCTGGTTGISKLAMVTHANALWAVYTTIGHMNLTEKDVGLQVLPLFHVIINNCLNSLMAAGAKVVLQHRFDAVEYMRNVHEEKVTVALVVPPFLFSWIMAVPEAIAYDITHVRAFATAAATFPRDLKESVRKYMPEADIFYSYGLTEASGGTVTVLPPSRLFDKDGSIGVVSAILDYRIVDGEGNPVREGRGGRASPERSLCRAGLLPEGRRDKNHLRKWLAPHGGCGPGG